MKKNVPVKAQRVFIEQKRVCGGPAVPPSETPKIPSEDFGLADLVVRPHLSIERWGHPARSSIERSERRPRRAPGGEA